MRLDPDTNPTIEIVRVVSNSEGHPVTAQTCIRLTLVCACCKHSQVEEYLGYGHTSDLWDSNNKKFIWSLAKIRSVFDHAIRVFSTKQFACEECGTVGVLAPKCIPGLSSYLAAKLSQQQYQQVLTSLDFLVDETNQTIEYDPINQKTESRVLV